MPKYGISTTKQEIGLLQSELRREGVAGEYVRAIDETSRPQGYSIDKTLKVLIPPRKKGLRTI